MSEVRIVRKSLFHPNRVEKGISSCRFREIFPYLCSAGQSAAAETSRSQDGTQPLPSGSSGDFPPDMKIVVGNEDRNLSRRRYRRIVGRSLHPEDDRNAGNQSGVGDHFFAHEHPYLSGQERRAAEDRTVAARAMSAPSGKDQRPWEFVVVNERPILDSLAAALPYAKMLAQAPCAVIVCGSPARSSYWYLDCSAAAENVLLAAHSLGLGGVWTAAYPYAERMEAVRSNLALPEGILPLCVIPIGYPAAVGEPKRKFDAGRIHYNGW